MAGCASHRNETGSAHIFSVMKGELQREKEMNPLRVMGD
jgi:hypothetical protein